MTAGRRSRAAYWLAGLLLIPFAVAITRTLSFLVRGFGVDSAWGLPPAAWAMAGGFLVWLFVFATLPRPMKTYILAHELTHVLWAWLSGARVSRVRIRSNSGSVMVSHSNVMITLAPYFFPLYTIIALIVYGLLGIWFDMRPYYLFWLGLVGFTWSFHVTFTVASLTHFQSDIADYGWLFSYVVIYIFNMAGLAAWLVAVGEPSLSQAARHFAAGTWAVWHWCAINAWEWGRRLYNKLAA